MPSTFVNPVVNPDAKLGVRVFDETAPVQLWQDNSEAEIEVVIRAVYRQILGNAYVMESERLVVPESQLKQREITIQEFVRQVAKSQLYRSRFFDNCPRYRAIELNFKHLLGRAPQSYEEMTYHSQLLDQKGYDAEIDSYIDSDEYYSAFGDNKVPYYRGYKTQPGKKMVGFTHMFKLLRGASSSDKNLVSGNRSRLDWSLMVNNPSKITPVVAVPFSWQPLSQPTDVNELLAKVLNIRALQAGIPTSDSSVGDPTRQRQYQGYQAFADTAPVELWTGCSEEEVETVIRAVYQQVLGNAYVMESERLVVPESQLRQGKIPVREFVRQVAQSELYRSRFFVNCYRYRAIELNFKHLLGRAPDDYSEMVYHSSILDNQGFEAEINSYLDSEEYLRAFGENIVPYYRGYKTQTGQKLLEFTNMLQLLQSASSSDKDLTAGNKPRLTRSLIINTPYGKSKTAADAGALLTEVLKPKPVEPALPTPTISEAEGSWQQQYEEQEALIAALQQQLAELRPFASVGSALIREGQFANAATVEPGLPSSTGISQPQGYGMTLQQKLEQQAGLIANLRQQITEARSLAAIGEARLNRWRQRTFF
jgi:phycobilisome core-membrane linker protein